MTALSPTQSLPTKPIDVYVCAQMLAHTEVSNSKNDRFLVKLEVDLCFNKDVPDAYTMATKECGCSFSRFRFTTRHI